MILHQYQQQAYQYLKDTKGTGRCLFVGLGLGKTAITLSYIDGVIGGTNKRVLIVAPKHVAEKGWKAELKLMDLKYTCKYLTRKECIIGTTDEQIIMISRDNISYFNNFSDFNILVIDELTSFKSNRSKRVKHMVQQLKDKRDSIELIGLTATPISNGLLDLYPQLLVTLGRERLEEIGLCANFTNFKATYFNVTNSIKGIPVEWEIMAGKEQVILDILKDNNITYTLKVENVTEIKKVLSVVEDIKLDFTPEELKEYKQFVNDKVMWYSDTDVLIPKSPATLMFKLLEYTSGSLYINDNKDTISVNNVKLKALENIIDNSGDNIILVVHYKHALKKVLKLLATKELLVITSKDKDFITIWNTKSTIRKILVVNAGSVGHGLNLQAGGNHIVWYDITYSKELYEQLNGRLVRQGQKEKVTITRLIINKTVDTTVLKVLSNKIALSNSILTELSN